MNKNLNAIDLFAGCGGLSKGFMDAGFNIIVGVDNDQAALNTFVKNHNGAVALNADLSLQDTFEQIKEIAGERKIDVIIAGPPCQGFSLTGPRDFDDKRNKLYLAVIEMVKQYQPKAFIIENVPGMATLYKGQIKEEILKRFRDMGYNIECKILCAADYGVPQIRKRLIFMGIRKDIGEPEFPKIMFTPETYRTCRDAVSDLPELKNDIGSDISEYSQEPLTEYQKLMRGNCTVLYNHLGTNHTQMVKDTIALVPEGGNYKDLPAGWGESRKFHMAWTRLNGNAPARTVDTGHRNLFHYEYNRIPTVRESARMQSFPDDFIFTGTKTQQSRQVGNAVPPLLGQALGKAILASMNTSDQNVFTLDTAFQRRWEMHLIKNDVKKAVHAENVIEGSTISWGSFAFITNEEIIRYNEETGSSEDKRLGAYFARLNELSKDKFPEKVLKYLWDDAFKMDRYAYFNETMYSLDNVIDAFRDESMSNTDILKRVLKYTVYQKMLELKGEDVNEQ